MEYINEYLQRLRLFYDMAQQLHAVVDAAVRIKSVTLYGDVFNPTETSVLGQLENWPKDLPSMLPPALWLEPNTGTITWKGEHWEYLFHGQGVSFIRSKDKWDISVEYTIDGEIGITCWNIGLFLRGLSSEPAIDHILLSDNETLFDQCIRLRHIIERSPRLGSDSDTFVLNF